MSVTTEFDGVRELDLIVAFFDLSGFARASRGFDTRELFDLLDQYYEFVGGTLAPAGGTVVKFMGDAGLVVYPPEAADAAVRSMMSLRAEGDAWLSDRGCASRHVIKAHVGPVVCGRVGTRENKRFDVFGLTVNTAAMLPSHGLAISPGLFRKLSPATRKLLKKHTPPVTYIPVDERHQD